jgi:hypothetical protein
MAEEFSNYDMLDKMIANSKRAKSWTVFWVTTLCLLAAAVLWMAFDIADKQQIIKIQKIALQSQEEFLESKNNLIDSLVANCKGQKANIVNKYDSVLSQTEQSINAIIRPDTTQGVIVTTGVTIADKNKLALVNKSLRASKTDLTVLKNKINKEQTKVFIQYNDKAAEKDIASLVEALKLNGNYYVAPPEYINNPFPSIVKMYNHTSSDNERNFFLKLLNSAGVNEKDVSVKRETNSKLSGVIEIWVNGRPR